MTAIPLVAKIVAVLVALAAFLGVVAYGVHQIKQDGAAQAQEAQAKQAEHDMAQARMEEQAQQAKIQESDHEANVFNAGAARDRDAARAAGTGLLQRVRAADAARVPSRAASDASGTAPGASASLCTDVLGRIEAATLDIGDYADRLRGSADNAVRQHAAAVKGQP